MRNRIWFFGKKQIVAGLCVILLTAVMLCVRGGKVYAGAEEQGLSAAVELISGNGLDTYDIRVTVSNVGKDLEGMVRLSVRNAYYASSCVYDTEITLPRDSEKQFVVQIPKESIRIDYDNSPEICLQVLDRKGKALLDTKYKDLFDEYRVYLSVGILSDTFNELTYLDMGGDTLKYFKGGECPLKMVELNADTLLDSLPGMTFLVIDRFHTASLSEEQLTGILDWVDEGGLLIVGTGKYAQDTLGGLEDYLGIRYIGDATGSQSVYDDPYYDEWSDKEAPVYVNLEDTEWRYDYQTPYNLYCAPQGEGAVGVLQFSLVERKEMGYAGLYEMYDAVASQSNMRYSYDAHSSNLASYMKRMLGVLNNSTSNLNFTMLNLIVLLYVVFVGPILYLILRAMKKRELYWLAVPASALLFVVFISLAGRGFQVRGVQVNSVSLARADGKGDRKTTMQCYNAGHEEWRLKLDDLYACAGSALAESYYYNDDPNDYAYRIIRDGQGLSLGANPQETFKDMYYFARGKNTETGSLDVEKFDFAAYHQHQGTVTNNTGRDFAYVAVKYGNMFLVYENLAAGETLYFDEAEPIYTDVQFSSVNNLISQYQYDLIYRYYRGTGGRKEDPEIAGQLAALGVGVGMLCDEESDFLIGLTDNYEKTVDDRCAERSYGCLYTVLQ